MRRCRVEHSGRPLGLRDVPNILSTVYEAKYEDPR